MKQQMISATDIHKSYSIPGSSAPTEVLRGASIVCEKGEFVAIVGPSGAGKSTLLHIMASVDIADSGTVVLQTPNGPIKYSDLSSNALAKFRNSTIGMVFQYHHLLPEFTAVENVMMPALIAGVSKSDAKIKAMKLLERIGLSNRADHATQELSGGEQQRVAIARAVINKPLLLFADEPTGNLDTENANIILTLISELQREYNLTCVIATHSADLVGSAHRVVTMIDGQCR